MSSGTGTPFVVIVATRVAAHAAASGYDRLQEYIDGMVIRPSERQSVPQRAVARSLRFLIKRSGSQWYHRQNFLSELEAAKHWLGRSDQIFHFLYGENSYRYLGKLKALNRRNSIVCTYHTPQGRFAEVVADRKHLARIDAAIAVSTVQLEFLAGLVAPDRVHFVPHGIDVEYFSPAADPSEESEVLSCLFVGSHLRDVDTLAKTARLLELNKRVRFTLVTRADYAAKFAGLGNVDVQARVDDAKLLQLYRQSDLLVFPLIDCTANNSLLEAMACGLPVLTTDLVGVRDYVSAECAVLVQKGAADQLRDELLGLESDRRRLRQMGIASRRRALEFRWEAVAEKTRRVYQGVR